MKVDWQSLDANKYVKLLFIAILCVPVILIAHREYSLKQDHRYTIGTTKGSRGGGRIAYQFNVNGEVFFGEMQRNKYSPIINGGRYLVIFSPTNPSLNHILWDKPVPDFVKEAPPEGWKEIGD